MGRMGIMLAVVLALGSVAGAREYPVTGSVMILKNEGDAATSGTIRMSGGDMLFHSNVAGDKWLNDLGKGLLTTPTLPQTIGAGNNNTSCPVNNATTSTVSLDSLRLAGQLAAWWLARTVPLDGTTSKVLTWSGSGFGWRPSSGGAFWPLVSTVSESVASGRFFVLGKFGALDNSTSQAIRALQLDKNGTGFYAANSADHVGGGSAITAVVSTNSLEAAVFRGGKGDLMMPGGVETSRIDGAGNVIIKGSFVSNGTTVPVTGGSGGAVVESTVNSGFAANADNATTSIYSVGAFALHWPGNLYNYIYYSGTVGNSSAYQKHSFEASGQLILDAGNYSGYCAPIAQAVPTGGVTSNILTRLPAGGFAWKAPAPVSAVGGNGIIESATEKTYWISPFGLQNVDQAYVPKASMSGYDGAWCSKLSAGVDLVRAIDFKFKKITKVKLWIWTGVYAVCNGVVAIKEIRTDTRAENIYDGPWAFDGTLPGSPIPHVLTVDIPDCDYHDDGLYMLWIKPPGNIGSEGMEISGIGIVYQQ